MPAIRASDSSSSRRGVAPPAQVIEQSLAPQHAEHGFGDEGAVVLAELAMFAEVAAQHRVGGMLEPEHVAQGFCSRFELTGEDGHARG